MLQSKKRALEIDIQDLVPGFFRQLPEHGVPGDAGALNQSAQREVPGRQDVEGCAHLLTVTDVRPEEDGIGLLRFPDVQNGNPGMGVQEGSNYGGTYSGPATGDGNALITKVKLHGLLPCWRGRPRGTLHTHGIAALFQNAVTIGTPQGGSQCSRHN